MIDSIVTKKDVKSSKSWLLKLVRRRRPPSSGKEVDNQAYPQFFLACYAIVSVNRNEYHLLKWVLATPLSQYSVCKIHTW